MNQRFKILNKVDGKNMVYPDSASRPKKEKRRNYKKITQLKTFYICPVCYISFKDIEKMRVHQIPPGKTFNEFKIMTTTVYRKRPFKKEKASYVPTKCKPLNGLGHRTD
ncbi:hypothetical protein TNCV_85091 [Trichonephila clavipes]|nr:hypothetical protein TNCV_85091 [Trichonephila clavipes]